MKMCEGVEVYLQGFLRLAVGSCEHPVSYIIFMCVYKHTPNLLFHKYLWMFKNKYAGFRGAEYLISHRYAASDKNSINSLYWICLYLCSQTRVLV
jgi:hypothetical protein